MQDITTLLFGEYVLLWALVESANFDPMSTAEDQIVWTHEASGNYSAKSAYLLQFEGCMEFSFHKHVWQVWAPSRCKFFMWLLLQNRVWTADRLLARQWKNEYFCPLCRRNMETACQLFLEWPFSRCVWIEISSWLSLPQLNPLSWRATWGLQDWSEYVAVRSASTRTRVAVPWSFWCVGSSGVSETRESLKPRRGRCKASSPRSKRKLIYGALQVPTVLRA
jgi:hypothetical protein